MADVYARPKVPKRKQSPNVRKQRRDYKRKRDEGGRFSSTERSVASRRFIRALRRKTKNNRQRKTRKTIYNEKGGLKSASARRAGKSRGTAKNSSRRTRR